MRKSKFKKTESDRLLPIDEENTPTFSSDVYKKGYTSEKITNMHPHSVKSLRPECSIDAPCFLNAVYQNSTQMKKAPADVLQYGRLLPIDEENTPPFSNDVYEKGYTSEKMTSRLPYSGRSMIEMLGVLAIIGVLSVGGIAGYSKAMHRYRLNKAIEQITQIAGNVRTFFAPQKSYAGLDNGCSDNDVYCKLYKKAKLLPDDMWNETSGEYIGVYGYRVNAAMIDKAKSGDKLAFLIGYYIGHTEESIETCIELITYDWSSAGVGAIRLGGAGAGTAYYFKTPISTDMAVDRCERSVRAHQSSDEKYPSLSFYFDIDLSGSYWNPKAVGRYDWQN